VPIKLVAFFVIGAVVTVFKMVQSLFVKVATDDPGRALASRSASTLGLAREQQSVGTRAVDEIRIRRGLDGCVSAGARAATA
jgi:hypothetical protein